ncbi:4312_t:CDS:2 [Paraglomus brasilianum]|uniref:UDP-N-acetylglucosamine--dolichyl-phosphate N-acetylglucosaminephosphotransferase n=1 Tax=Paraglomus brasilianum TaxID=144538 RepID=A0A9N9FXM8_9GLOM|nr:4312_t:CDS:2 [Paraglomus brasilianum]
MLSLTAFLTVASTITVALAIIFNTVHDPLTASIGFGILGGSTTWLIIPMLTESFLNAKRTGRDAHKLTKPILPESMGVVAATVYLICLFLFIPFPFMDYFTGQHILSRKEPFHTPTFPHNKLGEFLSALLSLQSMILLGFADDVFDIRWRYKLLLPTIASIPILINYYVGSGETHISVPIPFRFIFGQILDLGPIYYVYMGMMAVFCTNSINILAGINGVEIGQSLVIATSIAANDLLFLNAFDQTVETHLFSLFFLIPFIGVTIGLMIHNWFPARVFVGDTYCYFAGMTFAVVSVLGHFSKTLLLFFIPQIFNFVYSAPQLFKLVDCPRHRMPDFNPRTNKLEYSTVRLEQPLSPVSSIVIKLFALLRLVEIKHEKEEIVVNNFTLLNLILLKFGPMHERTPPALRRAVVPR